MRAVVTTCALLRHQPLPPRTAVRERAYRSQVTDLLTDVRSGRVGGYEFRFLEVFWECTPIHVELH